MADPSPAAPQPPFGSDRIAHLLQAARAEFLTHGYQHLSVDGLARASGVSKETIYRYFSDKAAIFRAAVHGLEESFIARLPALTDVSDPEHTLAACARAIHDCSVETDSASFMWITISVAREFPDLARALSADAWEGMEPIRAYMEQVAVAHDSLTVPRELAGLFGALATEGPRYLMGWPALSNDARDVAALRTARLYLHGCLTPAAAQFDPGPSALPMRITPRTWEPHLEALLREARARFFAHGYRGANLEDIGATARVGRGTLYRHFGSKAGLFEAAMLYAADELAARIPEPPTTGTLIERLQAIALQIATVLCSVDGIDLYCSVISEVRHAPRVAQQVYQRTREPFVAAIAAWLRAASLHDIATADDIDWHAMQFLTLATGGNRLLTHSANRDDTDFAQLAHTAVTLFQSGYLAADG